MEEKDIYSIKVVKIKDPAQIKHIVLLNLLIMKIDILSISKTTGLSVEQYIYNKCIHLKKGHLIFRVFSLFLFLQFFIFFF